MVPAALDNAGSINWEDVSQCCNCEHKREGKICNVILSREAKSDVKETVAAGPVKGGT